MNFYFTLIYRIMQLLAIVGSLLAGALLYGIKEDSTFL